MRCVRAGTARAALRVAAAALVFVTTVDQPARDPEPVPPVSAEAAPLVMVCPGGVERQIAQGLNVNDVDEQLTVSSLVVAESTLGTVRVEDSVGAELPAVGKAVFSPSDTALADVLTTDPIDPEALAWAGSTVHSAVAGDLRGIAGAPCLSPDNEAWFVGSESAIGTSNDLMITNPTETTVTIHLTALGATGTLDTGTRDTVVVAAGETSRVALGALAMDSRIAIHLYAESGTFGALLQQSVLDGAQPAGVDVISPSIDDTTLWIPAVRVDPRYEDSLRIVNPHDEAALVDVSVVDAEGVAALSGATNVDVPANSVMDLSLAGLDDGDYTLKLTADRDITAAVKHSLEEEQGTDIAWAAAQAPIVTGAAVIPAGTSTLVVSATDGAESTTVSAVPLAADGTEGDVMHADLEADGHVVLSLPEGTVAVMVSATDHVAAGVLTERALGDQGTGIDWTPVHSAVATRSINHIAIVP